MLITYVKSELDQFGGRITRTYDCDGRLIEVERTIGPRPGSVADHIHVRRHRVAAFTDAVPVSTSHRPGV